MGVRANLRQQGGDGDRQRSPRMCVGKRFRRNNEALFRIERESACLEDIFPSVSTRLTVTITSGTITGFGGFTTR